MASPPNSAPQTAPAGRAPATLAYLEEEILASGPLALVAKVFDMAAQHVGRARAALAARDYAGKSAAVRQISRCLTVLQTSLNLKEGGELALNFHRIYAYLHRRLNDAHAQNDDQAFAEIAGHLAELGSAWREVSARPLPPAAAEAGTAVGSSSAR